MLDLYIIEYLKEKEKREQETERPYLELPLPEPVFQPDVEEKPEPKRVIIIDTIDEELDDFTIVI
mgnify:CR=1 FL=1|tara:strand:- start:471 stop:665 length:195 start_codon:yes stop_codon:yes gene_type:complete